jgi:hypothetical protein
LLHAPIITHSPGIARGRACICAGFFVCKCLRHMDLGPSAPAPSGANVKGNLANFCVHHAANHATL